MGKKNDISCGFGGVSVNVILIRFTQITKSELGILSTSDQLDLIKTAFLPYILNGYSDEGITIPPEYSEVWARCKALIEKETGK